MTMEPYMYKGIEKRCEDFIKDYTQSYPNNMMAYYVDNKPVELLKRGCELSGELKHACESKHPDKYIDLKDKIDDIIRKLEKMKYKNI